MFNAISNTEILARSPAPWAVVQLPQPGRYTMVDKNGTEVPLEFMLQFLAAHTSELAAKQ